MENKILSDESFHTLGIEKASETMEKFYTAGNNMLLKLRNITTSPEKRKKPRTWGRYEAAQMVAVSAPTLRKLEAEHEIPGIKKDENNRYKYTLEAINFLRELAGTRYKRPPNSKLMVVSISNLKGGVGKTETSVDLGKKSAIEGLRTLLIDLDPQATATLISSGLIPDLEIDYEKTLVETLLSNPSKIKDIILKTHFNGFDIIPANLALQDCELGLANDTINNSKTLGSPLVRLRNAIKYIQNDYDLILIDSSPNLGILTLNAIMASNGLIIPIPPSMYDYSSFIMYTGTLNHLFETIEVHEPKSFEYFRILISKHSGSNEALQMESIIRTQFSGYVLSNHMCETVEVPKAANEIGSVYDLSKPLSSREAYQRAIQHLNDVNMEIINDFKEIWKKQAQNEVKNT